MNLSETMVLKQEYLKPMPVPRRHSQVPQKLTIISQTAARTATKCIKNQNATKLTFKTPGWSLQSSSNPRRASRRTFALWCCKCANSSLRPNLKSLTWGPFLRRWRWRWVNKPGMFMEIFVDPLAWSPSWKVPSDLRAWKTSCQNFLGIRMKKNSR